MGNAGSSGFGSGANEFSLGQLAASTRFTKEELRDMHTSFMAAAKESSESGSTVITRAQFGEILSAAHWESENAGFLSVLYDAFDKNADGVVNFAEFSAGASVILKGTSEEKYQLCFEMYDIDKSGSISMDEMKKVFRAMNLTLSVAERERRSYSDDEIDEFVAKVFEKASKTIYTSRLSYKEFLRAVKLFPELVRF